MKFGWRITRIKTGLKIVFLIVTGFIIGSLIGYLIRNAISPRQDYELVRRDGFEDSGDMVGKFKIDRPRYAADELHIRKRLFVGIIAEKNIDELLNGMCFLLDHVADRVVIFTSNNQPFLNDTKFDVVSFTDKNEIHKPFYVLKYLNETEPDEYSWTMIINDDTYVHVGNLKRLVKSLSASDYRCIGTSHSEDSSHPSIKNGIILAHILRNPTLENLDQCQSNWSNSTISTDRFFADCIFKSTGIRCTGNIRKKLSYKSMYFDRFDTNLIKSSLESTITLRPIESLNQFNIVNSLVAKFEIDLIDETLRRLQKELIKTDQKYPVGLSKPFKPTNRFDVNEWDYFDYEKERHYSVGESEPFENC
ncbi:hypothetical protein ACOME3_005108 [Neoechinorhynchus agilis]